MNTEDLFKYGVTPKEGKNAGKRFRVLQIYPERTIVADWNDEDAPNQSWATNTYEIWHEPKTLFEDSNIEPTWGNLKKAMEAAGVSDDTEFAVQEDASWFYRGLCRPATFSVETLRELYGKPKKYIIVK